MNHRYPRAPPDAETMTSGVAPPPAAAPDPAPPEGPLANADTLDSPDGNFAPVAATATTSPRLGRYVLLSKLGEGGMGEVYSGYDEELDRRVALKIVRSTLAGNQYVRVRMQREAQALARLSHPNVVQVHDVGTVGDQLFLAMEYVRGETLREWQVRHEPETAEGRRAIIDMYLQAGRGLAAAHAARIVHRDFKPGNVLVGDDGRARVLDFGLAAERQPAAKGRSRDIADSSERSVLDSDLTRTGSVLGTPAYMAPEQFLAEAIDHRTDIFAFSLALYEALYGESPFGGVSFVERRKSVVEGRVRAAPADSRVPAWLRAVLLRGLARDPAARWSTMTELLDAVADDPIARAQRRWRLLGLGLLAIVVAAALLAAGLFGWQRRQHALAEAAAAERQTAVAARIDELLGKGAAAEAEQVFFSFVEHPDNRGTAALGRAWLERAARARERGDSPGAIDAFAATYTVATADSDQSTALLGLARIFRDELKWRELSLTLSTLAGHDPELLDADDEARDLRLTAAIASRDLDAALSLLRGPLAPTARSSLLPSLTALRQATATNHQHRGSAAVADFDGDGTLELLLETNTRDRQIAPLLRAEPDLPLIRTLDLDTARFRAITPGAGQPALLVSSESRMVDGQFERDAVVRRMQDGALSELLRWREDAITSALAADVDGDGERELLVGTGPYTRRVTQLVPEADASWSRRSPAPDLDRRRSDIVDLLAADVDGDGTTEVIAALGPWHAYELDVLRHDPATDTLRAFARARLGNLSGATLLRRDPARPGLEIAVSKTDEYRNPTVFPRDRPDGEPSGVYTFRLEDNALTRTSFVPAPRLPPGAGAIFHRPFAADLDGDDRDELIVGCSITDNPSADERDSTQIFVDSGDGTFATIALGNVWPIAALDLDGDGDDELIVSDSAGDIRDRVWVLGSGSEALPVITAALPPAAESTLPDDRVVAQMWVHADELAHIGLLDQAAEGWATVADQSAEPDLRARALLRAAELQSTLAADERAAELFARAAQEPSTAQRAHAGAARSSLFLGRLDAASVHAAALAEPEPALTAALTALRAEDGVALAFDRPLDDRWRVEQPLFLRRDGGSNTLHVDAIVPGELLSTPVSWPGRSLLFEVDLELERVEWRGGLEIGLMRDGTGLADGSSPLGLEVATVGGGSERTLELACMSYGRRSVARLHFTVGQHGDRIGRLAVRATLLPELGVWTCQIDRADGSQLLYARHQLAGEPLAGGPLRLAINSSRGPAAWVSADIHRITLAGASRAPETLADARDEARILAHHAFAEDEPLAARAAVVRIAAPTPADRLLAVMADARLGRLAEAEQALRPLFADTSDDSRNPSLEALLRVEPRLFGALVRGAAGPDVFRERLASAWYFTVLLERDPAAFAVVWSGLAEHDPGVDSYDVLRVYAAAAARLGRVEAARAGYRAALTALADPQRIRGSWWPEGMIESERFGLHLELAALALAAGDEAAARRELAPQLGRADADPLFGDRLRARDDLRPLWDLAPD